MNATAIVFFSGGAQAERLVAGVPAGARVLHAVREAGATRCRLTFGDGWIATPKLRGEIARLAGSMAVELNETGADVASPAGGAIIHGSRLPTVEEVRAILLGSILPAPPGEEDTVAIDRRYKAAAGEIVRATAKPGDGIISRSLNRPISQTISSLLLRIPGIRPVHATVGTALLAVGMLFALVLGTRSGQVWGAVLFQSASIFDGVDGEIARATYHTSRHGAKLDSLVDAFTNLAFVLGLAINLAIAGAPRPAVAGAVGLVLLGAGLTLIGRASARSGEPFGFDVVKQHYRGQSGGKPTPLMRAATFITSRDFFALIFAIAIFAGFAGPMLELFALATFLWFIAVVRALAARRP